MHYGFNNKDFSLFINGQELKSTESEKDLVVIFAKIVKKSSHFMREQTIFIVHTQNV